MQQYVIFTSNLWPEINIKEIGPHIIPFGALRIGNRRFSRFANKVVPHHCITHGNNHVPYSPWYPLKWNYFGFEIWIELSDNCNCSDDDVNFQPY
ncbi:hypothetical protein G9A89_023036 [Geosiphon pyriformis]|nr:hypothetical protein G9A89_023036 [Geosiphon pyriformis]